MYEDAKPESGGTEGEGRGLSNAMSTPELSGTISVLVIWCLRSFEDRLMAVSVTEFVAFLLLTELEARKAYVLVRCNTEELADELILSQLDV